MSTILPKILRRRVSAWRVVIAIMWIIVVFGVYFLTKLDTLEPEVGFVLLTIPPLIVAVVLPSSLEQKIFKITAWFTGIWVVSIIACLLILDHLLHVDPDWGLAIGFMEFFIQWLTPIFAIVALIVAYRRTVKWTKRNGETPPSENKDDKK